MTHSNENTVEELSERSLERIQAALDTLDAGRSDAECAAELGQLLMRWPKSSAKRILLCCERKWGAECSGLWRRYPQLNAVYAAASGVMLNLLEDERGNLHLKWLATSGHPLAARVGRFYMAGQNWGFEHIVGSMADFNFETVGADESAGLLPFASSFLLANDDLTDLLDARASLAFRDLWALFDAEQVPSEDNRRLALARELQKPLRSASDERARASSAFVAAILRQIRDTAVSLSASQRQSWMSRRAELWGVIQHPEARERYLAELAPGEGG